MFPANLSESQTSLDSPSFEKVVEFLTAWRDRDRECPPPPLQLYFRWELRREIIHSDSIEEQPVGEVGFNLSDFLDTAILPPDYCRPLVGIHRLVLFLLVLLSPL